MAAVSCANMSTQPRGLRPRYFSAARRLSSILLVRLNFPGTQSAHLTCHPAANRANHSLRTPGSTPNRTRRGAPLLLEQVATSPPHLAVRVLGTLGPQS